MRFRNRLSAGALLAVRLAHFRGTNPLVLGIPRGAVPMARVVAEALGGDLDVVLVRKIGAPANREFAVGAVTEAGEVALNPTADGVDVDPGYVAREATARVAELKARRERLCAGAEPADPAGRVVIVVDDGVASGATMLAALNVLRRKRPKWLVAAVAVAPPDAVQRLADVADDVVVLDSPEGFRAVGNHFDDFTPVTDDDVVETLSAFRRQRTDAARPAAAVAERRLAVSIPADGASLEGELVLPSGARGLVVFSHGSGSSRKSPRNLYVAERLRRRGLGTLLLDLLTEEEDRVRANRFDIDLLTRRLESATRWAGGTRATAALPLGYFGASTGAACALRAAARLPGRVRAVVSRGGRPDLAMPVLDRVRAPTLLVVGGQDDVVIDLNQVALARLVCEKRLAIVPGATHLFEEPGTLEAVAELAAHWFGTHLASGGSKPFPATPRPSPVVH